MANNQLLASDNFASGSLAAGWSVITGLSESTITSPAPFYAQPGAVNANEYGQFWSGLTWPNDHTSEITVQALTQEVGSDVDLWVRVQSGSQSGYVAQIGNNTLTIYRADSAVFTSLKVVTGFTVASGDVIAFQAAGAVLSVYKNSARLGYIADTTYTSGSPGFSQRSSVAQSHALIASWRGYNAVQQDGIWSKQGIAIPALASDLASSGFGTFQPTVFKDSNAQILSGTVYKMWFTGGGATTANMYYAESSDGKTWTRRGTAVLSGFANGVVLKNGSTYYMYTQAANAQGTGNIQLYSSADGINWSLVNNNVLSAGGVGAWDQSGFYCLAAPVIWNGTWYMAYTGSASGSNGLFKTGIATSPDGVNWTKYAGNPVISNAVPACAPVFANNRWYLYVASGPSSPFWSGAAQNYDPTETVRYQSTDFFHWTNSAYSQHHSQMYESLNTFTGQNSVCAIVDVGGIAYTYGITSPGDNTTPQDYQIGYAVGPSSLENIVKFPEDGTTQVVSDNFSSGSLHPNWTQLSSLSPLQVVGGLVEATALNVLCAAYYTNAQFSTDQYSEITIQTLQGVAGLNDVAPIVRCDGNRSYYQFVTSGPTGSLDLLECSIAKLVNGVSTLITPVVSITPQVGDVLRISAVGNVISGFQNGHMVLQGVDLANSLPTGRPGMLIFAQGTLAQAQISKWAGGNANQIPAYAWSPQDCREFSIFPNLNIVQPSGAIFFIPGKRVVTLLCPVQIVVFLASL